MSKIGLLTMLVAANVEQRKAIVEGHLLSLGYEVTVGEHYIYAPAIGDSTTDTLIAGFLDNPSHIVSQEEPEIPLVTPSEFNITIGDYDKGWGIHTGAQIYACLRTAEVKSGVSFLFIDDFYGEPPMKGLEEFIEEEAAIPDFVVTYESDYDIDNGIVCETYSDPLDCFAFDEKEIKKIITCECEIVKPKGLDSSIASMLFDLIGNPSLSFTLGVKDTYTLKERVNIGQLNMIIEDCIYLIESGIEETVGEIPPLYPQDDEPIENE